ncbi:hypothetical protein PS2_039399 [Malus domestica]
MSLADSNHASVASASVSSIDGLGRWQCSPPSRIPLQSRMTTPKAALHNGFHAPSTFVLTKGGVGGVQNDISCSGGMSSLVTLHRCSIISAVEREVRLSVAVTSRFFFLKKH